MAAFTKLNWGDLDVFAILVGNGIATLEPTFAKRSLAWVSARGYQIVPIDFGAGIGPVVSAFGQYFNWEHQFGYALESSDRNLARLRDGFWYEVPAAGLVLELRDLENAFTEDQEWSKGFLGIVSEHSQRQLALGHRFFALAHVSNENSPVVGCALDEKVVPYPYELPRRAPDG